MELKTQRMELKNLRMEMKNLRVEMKKISSKCFYYRRHSTGHLPQWLHCHVLHSHAKCRYVGIIPIIHDEVQRCSEQDSVRERCCCEEGAFGPYSDLRWFRDWAVHNHKRLVAVTNLVADFGVGRTSLK